MRELGRCPFVHVGPDRRPRCDDVREREGASIVGNDKVKAARAETFTGLAEATRSQFHRPVPVECEPEHTARAAGQRRLLVIDGHVVVDHVRGRTIADRGHVAMSAEDLELAQDAGVPNERRHRDAEDPGRRHGPEFKRAARCARHRAHETRLYSVYGEAAATCRQAADEPTESIPA